MLGSNPTRDTRVRAGEWPARSRPLRRRDRPVPAPFICPAMPQKTQPFHSSPVSTYRKAGIFALPLVAAERSEVAMGAPIVEEMADSWCSQSTLRFDSRVPQE
jgi:hypothetical protein